MYRLKDTKSSTHSSGSYISFFMPAYNMRFPYFHAITPLPSTSTSTQRPEKRKTFQIKRRGGAARRRGRFLWAALPSTLYPLPWARSARRAAP